MARNVKHYQDRISLDQIIAQLKTFILIADTSSSGEHFDDFSGYVQKALWSGLSLRCFELINGKEGKYFNE